MHCLSPPAIVGACPGQRHSRGQGGYAAFLATDNTGQGEIFGFYSRGQYMIQRWAGAWTVTSPWQIAATANILQPSVFLPFQLSNLESRPRTQELCPAKLLKWGQKMICMSQKSSLTLIWHSVLGDNTEVHVWARRGPWPGTGWARKTRRFAAKPGFGKLNPKMS